MTQLQSPKKDLNMEAGLEAAFNELRKGFAQDPEMKKTLEQELGVCIMHCMFLADMLGTTMDEFMKNHEPSEFNEAFAREFNEQFGCCDGEPCDDDECECCGDAESDED